MACFPIPPRSPRPPDPALGTTRGLSIFERYRLKRLIRIAEDWGIPIRGEWAQ